MVISKHTDKSYCLGENSSKKRYFKFKFVVCFCFAVAHVKVIDIQI